MRPPLAPREAAFCARGPRPSWWVVAKAGAAGSAVPRATVVAEGETGAGLPSSVTVTYALAGARDDLPRKRSTLVPIMTRKTAAMAV